MTLTQSMIGSVIDEVIVITQKAYDGTKYGRGINQVSCDCSSVFCNRHICRRLLDVTLILSLPSGQPDLLITVDRITLT
jgi:hypothetical protein